MPIKLKYINIIYNIIKIKLKTKFIELYFRWARTLIEDVTGKDIPNYNNQVGISKRPDSYRMLGL